MTKLTTFTREDYFGFAGAEPLADGSKPRIYHFTDEEIEAFFDLMSLEYVKDNCENVFIIQGGSGMELGWTYGSGVFTVFWPEGEISERNEYLLEFLDYTTLPLWAMSAAKAKYQEM